MSDDWSDVVEKSLQSTWYWGGGSRADSARLARIIENWLHLARTQRGVPVTGLAPPPPARDTARMAIEPIKLATLQRDRLRAQADMFAAVASHGTIVGTAREIALIEFFRGLIPKRFEVLSGAIAEVVEGRIGKASSQLDAMIVDTFEYPTLLRTGDLAIVLPSAVRVVVEAKSDLARGQKFLDAMEQIGQARLLTGPAAFTALFCFGAPTHSETLRGWLEDLLRRRTHLNEWAQGAGSQTAADGTPRPSQYQAFSRDDLFSIAAAFSAANLPDVVLADEGAIAIRVDDNGQTRYEFFSTENDSPSIAALAAKVLAHIAQRAVEAIPAPGSASPQAQAFQLLITHYEAALVKAGLEPLIVTDSQPKAEESTDVHRTDQR